MLKGILQNDLFYCNHLGVSEHDEQDILNFTVKDQHGQGLVNYLRFMAFPEEDAGTMRTYVVRDNFSSDLFASFFLLEYCLKNSLLKFSKNSSYNFNDVI